MKRRVLLKRAAALGSVGAVAGCLEDIGSSGGDGDAGGDGDDPTPTENPTATPTETPTEEPTPSVATEGIETEETDCMTGDQNASVSFETDAGTVVVDGAIQSPDPCHEATLEAVEYDAGDDRLTVSVGVEAPGNGACQSCLGVVQYRAEVGFDAALPGHVAVEHVGSDGETTTITEASQ